MEIRRVAGPHAAGSFVALNRHAQPAPAPFLSFPAPTKQHTKRRGDSDPHTSASPLSLGFLSHHQPPDPGDLRRRPLGERREEGRRRGSRRRRRREAQRGRRGRCSCGTGSTGCWPPSACGRRRPRSSSLASTTPARPRCSTCSRTRYVTVPLLLPAS